MQQNEAKEIRDILMDVKYPGSSQNIVALDMVQQVRTEGKKVSFRLVFQRKDDPFAAAVKKKCEKIGRAHV